MKNHSARLIATRVIVAMVCLIPIAWIIAVLTGVLPVAG